MLTTLRELTVCVGASSIVAGASVIRAPEIIIIIRVTLPCP